MANGLSKALLGGQQGASLSPSGQTRIDLARALASRSVGGGPVQGGPLDALSRVGQAFFARQMLDEQQQAEQQRQQALAQTLQRVTRAGQQGVVTGPGGGGTGEVATPDQRIIDALASNEQTAPFAAKLTLEQALNPEGQSQTVPGPVANELLGTSGFGANDAVTIESSPQGGAVVTDVFETDAQPERRTISAEEANEQFGTNLSPGAAVTIERAPGAQDFSIVDVEGGVERREEGEPGGFASPVEARKFRDQEINTRSLIATIQDGVQLLEKNPDINTFVARGAGFINNIRAEVEAWGRQFEGGLELEDSDKNPLNPDDFRDVFEELGIKNARLRSILQTTAYSVARSREGGRLSESDIRSALITIGQSASDADVLQATLQDVARRAARRLEIREQVTPGAKLSGPLPTVGQKQEDQQGAASLGDIPPIPDAARNEGVTPDLWKAMTPEERSLFTENQ